MQYFETESNDRTNKADHRKACGDLNNAITGGDFELYLVFLKAELKILAKMNTALQLAGQSVYTAYATIRDAVQEFAEPIVWDERKSWEELLSDDNVHDFGSDLVFHVSEFLTLKEQLIENGVLTGDQAEQVHRNCNRFIMDTTRAIQTRFPELPFVILNVSFLVPEYRSSIQVKHCNIAAAVERFTPNRFEVVVKDQFRSYCFTSDLDQLRETSHGPDNFFCHCFK